MKKQGMRVSDQTTKRSRGASVCLRAVCAVLCMLMLLTSLVGCASYAKADDMTLLEDELRAASESIEKLKKDRAESQEELEALKEEYNASKQKITQLQSDVKVAEKDLSSLKTENANAQKEIASLKEADAANQKELDALKAANADSLLKIEGLEAIIESLRDVPAEEKIRVYIDQGHNPTGSHNTGTESEGIYEQDLTYLIGVKLAQLLIADGRFEVRLSRPTSTTVLGTDNNSSLDARVQGATDFEADYFISLHINSFTQDTASGIEVYTLEDTGISYDFGSALLQGLIDATGLRNRNMKTGEYRVLKNATMPAALVEMGFLSNPGDRELLSTQPELFARGLYNGMLWYFFMESPVPDAESPVPDAEPPAPDAAS